MRKPAEQKAIGLRPHSVAIDGRPQVKERPRVNRRTGTIYTPEKTTRAEERVAAHWVASKGPKYPKGTQLRIFLMFDEDSTAIVVEPFEMLEKVSIRGDLDNYVKLVMDGLNGVAWDDDSQVVRIEAVKA